MCLGKVGMEEPTCLQLKPQLISSNLKVPMGKPSALAIDIILIITTIKKVFLILSYMNYGLMDIWFLSPGQITAN